MKKIEMLFYSTPPKKAGMKFVLWEILIEAPGQEPDIKHDWGFAYWNGESWDGMAELPEGYTAVVCRWADTVDPAELLEEKKIIRI